MKQTLLFGVFLLGISANAFSQWTNQAAVPAPVGQEGAVGHPNGNAYVFGGFTNSTNPVTTLNIFNQSANTWSTGAPIPNPTRGMAYCLGPDSCIYCISGYYSGDVTTSYKYKPSTNTWTLLANIPTPTWEAAATSSGGKILVFGGEVSGPSTNLQIYDPVADSWTTGAPVPLAVDEEAAVAAPNGKIYVIGGLGSSGIMNNVQIYDPVGNSWTTGAPMPTARNEFAYTLGPDGKIYCMGGKSNGGNNNSPFYNVVEIYDPVANTWSTGPILPHGIGETAGTTVNNGINVFAGADSSLAYSTYNFRMNFSFAGIAEYKNEVSFNVYPNPASQVLNFGLSAADKESFELRILDMTGKVVYSESQENFAGSLTKTIDISSLRPGLYLAQCHSDHADFTRKIIVE